ncbi:MAG: hypothetical protein WBW73_17265 [Rhodoplanes sp.]
MTAKLGARMMEHLHVFGNAQCVTTGNIETSVVDVDIVDGGEFLLKSEFEPLGLKVRGRRIVYAC